MKAPAPPASNKSCRSTAPDGGRGGMGENGSNVTNERGNFLLCQRYRLRTKVADQLHLMEALHWRGNGDESNKSGS